MDLLIEGGYRLEGEIRIHGAKNAALPIVAATLLTADECVLENVPHIEDIRAMEAVLESLGARVERDDHHRLVIKAEGVRTCRTPDEVATKLRGSFLVMGPLLARFGRAEAAHPGGCAIGTRPVSVDVKGFAIMGAEIVQADGHYTAQAPRLMGRRMTLDYPSHTGTENLMMAACLAEGVTVIENASVEPEVIDLANFLRAMGARISGAGTGIIEIEGVERLHGAVYRVMPDRLEAGTFAIAAAITRGSVVLEGVIPQHLRALSSKLMEAGVGIREEVHRVIVRGAERLQAVDIRTFPYPGFPTDLQAPFGALMTQAHGESAIHETMYDDRLLYVGELRKMGAQIQVKGQTALITGPTPLKGTSVRVLDIRSGAAVILAGLVAEGETIVSDMYYVDRGYERIDERLASLGARVRRMTGQGPISGEGMPERNRGEGCLRDG
ncbi:MAG TPA: UDP-N-acetylglucosamine 1-carboxyvinyltransferase [Anaerolineae bacterium]|nr:UDP-N-acetylglucosamine 1-carboxyvinyltransferase [Anaerolineae bacterium]